MSRRRRENGFEASVDLASRLPWWLGIILAVLSYLILHPFAVAPIAPPSNMHAMGEAMAGQIYRTAAMFGQYLLPAIFLFGAVWSAVKAYRNRRLFAETPRTAPAVGAQSAVPACPSCGAAMVRRVAKKGVNSGREFWGCSRYPACKGTR